MRQTVARQRLAAILDRTPDYWPALQDAKILVGELEELLHDLEEAKPAGETWPRNSRPVYEQALSLLVLAGENLSVASVRIRALERELELLERPGRITASTWLSTMPALIGVALRAAGDAYGSVAAVQDNLIELGNTLRRAVVDGSGSEFPDPGV